MPRSSRHKSHKQHKHREAREYSDEDEVVSYRERKEKEEVVVRVKESGSSEKRKDNGGVAEEYAGSKKRKDRSDGGGGGGGDRWNGGDKEMKIEKVEKIEKIEIVKIDSEKVVKSKVLVDAKSLKSSRKHEAKEIKDTTTGLVTDIEEVKRSSNSKIESKSKSERIAKSQDKEAVVYKESKDKERGVERIAKAQDGGRHEKSVDRVAAKVGLEEGSRKQSSHFEEKPIKPDLGNTEILMKETLRNLESEKELEKRNRKKRDGSDDKEKYSEDLKDSSGRRLSTKDERHKDEKHKDEKHKDDKYKDEKYKDEKYKDEKYKDEKYKDDKYKDDKYKDEKYKDEKYKDDRYKDKYREDLDRDQRNRGDRARDDHLDRDHRNREDRVRDDHLDRDHRIREDRVRDDRIDRDHRSREDRVREDHLDRDHRNREDRVREDHLDRDRRNRDDRIREDHLDKDHRSREDRVRADHLDRDHRNREDRVRDDHFSKDHTGDRSDARHSRDESKSAIEDRHKKSKTQNIDLDGSPHLLDDRTARYKDYRGKKRSPDDEDGADLKHRNTKERRYEVEKKGSGGKIEALADRERSHSRIADVDSALRGSRRKSSPSSGGHLPNDSFRHSSKQSEMKYKDSASEDKIRAAVTSSREHTKPSGAPDRVSESRSTKPLSRPVHKDQNYLSDLPSERSPIYDAPVSQLKEKSHSATSIERRPSNRTPVRRNIDVDETRHRSSASKDVRDYSTNDDRRSQEWPMDKPPAADDGDTVSVCSSFNRGNHLPTGSSSVLPPPPLYRTGSDSPVFSSFDDDTRSKSSNRYKRSGDNVGRGPGNAWKGVQNWPTPVPNGFMPFPQGPTPGGFHPMMQQFHPPPMFRPSMELNPTGVPFHIPDADRYPGHGRSFPWRNRMDDVPPHMHGWDGSNGPDWDPNRQMMNDRGWEANSETWKGQNNGPTMDFPSVPWKEDQRSQLEEVSSGKPGQRSRGDRSRSVSRAESIEIKVSDDIPAELVPIDSKQVTPEEIPDPSKIFNKNGFLNVYLSKLDISVDLAQPDVYEQCMSLFDNKGSSTDCNENKDLSMEVRGKARVNLFGTSMKSPLLPKINESNFQRSMNMYKLQREEWQTKFPIPSALGSEPKNRPTSDGENLIPDSTITDQVEVPVPALEGVKEELIPTSVDVNMKEVVPVLDAEAMNELAPVSVDANVEPNVDELVPASVDAKADEPNGVEGEKSFPSLGEKVAVEPSDFVKEEKDETAPNSPNVVIDSPNINSNQPEEQVPVANQVVKMEVEVEEDANPAIVENLQFVKDDSQQTLQSASAKDPSMDIDTVPNISDKKNNSIDDTMCGNLGVTDGSEACEELTPMSIDCKSVNLSRIHSPGSTH